jgi:hypothetical protein
MVNADFPTGRIFVDWEETPDRTSLWVVAALVVSAAVWVAIAILVLALLGHI